MTRRHMLMGLILAMCTMYGCDSGSAQKTPPGAGSTTTADGVTGKDENAIVVDLKGSAVLRGTVRLQGQTPSPAAFKMSGDPYCVTTSQGKALLPDGMTVGEAGALPHVFVYIRKGIDGKYTPPAEAVLLDQVGCHYTPHVFGLMVGQPLRIRNSDPTAHNVHALPKRNTAFNISQPVQGDVREKTFTKPEVMVRIKCDVHGWMEAYCGVLPHPFSDVTDSKGAFEIAELPPGEYEVEAWHEHWGTLRKTITVSDGAEQEIDFTFSKGGS